MHGNSEGVRLARLAACATTTQDKWSFYLPQCRLPTRLHFRRIMQLAEECFGGTKMQAPDLHALVDARIQQAVALRAALGLRCLPAAPAEGQQAPQQAGQQQEEQRQATTVFRLINSEGDRLSGLIVDVLGDHLVVSSSGERLGTVPGAVPVFRKSGCCCCARTPVCSCVSWHGLPVLPKPTALAVVHALHISSDCPAEHPAN